MEELWELSRDSSSGFHRDLWEFISLSSGRQLSLQPSCLCPNDLVTHIRSFAQTKQGPPQTLDGTQTKQTWLWPCLARHLSQNLAVCKCWELRSEKSEGWAWNKDVYHPPAQRDSPWDLFAHHSPKCQVKPHHRQQCWAEGFGETRDGEELMGDGVFSLPTLSAFSKKPFIQKPCGIWPVTEGSGC